MRAERRVQMRGGGREDSSDNELSIETKAELYNFIMRLILRKYKCNDDNEVSLMRTTTPIHTQCVNRFPEQTIIQRAVIKTFNKDTSIKEEVKRFIQKLTVVLTSVQTNLANTV